MEEGSKQAEVVLHGQDDAEVPEGALQDISSVEGCGCGREGGGISPLANWLVDDGKRPLRANLEG